MTQTEIRKLTKAARPSFIQAYRYLYGATIEEAEKAYKEAEISYTWTIVDSWKYDARTSFYND